MPIIGLPDPDLKRTGRWEISTRCRLRQGHAYGYLVRF